MHPTQILVITPDHIMNLHSMLEQLTEKVEQIDTKLEGIVVPASSQIAPAPDRFEVSLSFLAAATGTSKSTIERRIGDNRLPKPRTNPDNGYRFWLKSDLPKSLHAEIDAHYSTSTKASR